MIRFHAHRHQFVVLFALLSLMVLGGTVTSAASDPASAAPILSGVVNTTGAPGTVTVTGKGFTSGGAVSVALYDRWSAKLHETRFTTAVPAFHGPNGSQDPAVGYSPGGILSEAFGGLCGAPVMVRAYDWQTAQWSNWLDVESTTASPAFYGPNGGLDPAVGFSRIC